MEAANSPGSQKIKSRFVEMHVKANVTALISFILDRPDYTPPFTWDDVTGIHYYEDWMGNRYSPAEREDKLAEYRALLPDILNDDSAPIPTSQEIASREILLDAFFDLRDAARQHDEIMEWWLVSDWLAEQLAKEKEAIVSDGDCFYWGRQTSGQAVKMDEVIHKICEDLQISEGLPDQWQP